MPKRSAAHLALEPQVGNWDALFASVDDLVRRRPQAMDGDRSYSPNMRSKIDLGICAVPIYRVVGHVANPPFESWLSQQHLAGNSIAQQDIPIEMYKVGDAFYVRSGHSLVAAARKRGQLFLRARVTEYLLDPTSRATNIVATLIDHERSDFLRRFPFPEGHPMARLKPGALGSYQALANHIEKTLAFLPTHEYDNLPALLTDWYDRVYMPVARLIRRRAVMAHFPAYSEIEMYLWACSRYQPTDEQNLRQQLRLARRSIAALWIATQTQHKH